MQRVIAVIPLTLCLALSVTKADSISLASTPVGARVLPTERTAARQWLAARDVPGFPRLLPLPFFDRAAFDKAAFDRVAFSPAGPTASTAYVFLSALRFGVNYPIQRPAGIAADGRRAALPHLSDAHAARGGIEELGLRVYRVLFETRIRERKPRRPSD